MGKAKVVVLGGSGFVGSAVCEAVECRGGSAMPIHAPRITVPPGTDPEKLVIGVAEGLKAQLAGAAAVVNAAGIPDAASGDSARLKGANALVPMAIALACSAEGVRLVHISSAAVQGRQTPLDSAPTTAPLTPYARSKAEGERLVRMHDQSAVIYRPPGVHGPTRLVTQSLVRLASGPASSVARPGDGNAPQALISDVADAVAFLALSPTPPPSIVHHPPSGLSTSALLRLLGGREPRQVPRNAARMVVQLVRAAGRCNTAAAAHARRLEVLWFGQEQAPSWLTSHGWHGTSDAGDWHRLGQRAQDSANRPNPKTGSRHDP